MALPLHEHLAAGRTRSGTEPETSAKSCKAILFGRTTVGFEAVFGARVKLWKPATIVGIHMLYTVACSS